MLGLTILQHVEQHGLGGSASQQGHWQVRDDVTDTGRPADPAGWHMHTTLCPAVRASPLSTSASFAGFKSKVLASTQHLPQMPHCAFEDLEYDQLAMHILKYHRSDRAGC